MKKYTVAVIIYLFLAAVMISLIFYLAYSENIKPRLVKPGQVWVHQNEQNPFEPIKHDSTYILEIKNNYCKYKRVFYEDSVKTNEIISTDKTKYVVRFSKKVRLISTQDTSKNWSIFNKKIE